MKEMEERWNFTKKRTIEGHSGAIYSIQFDGIFLYSASADKYIVRWDIATGEQDNFAIKTPTTAYAIQLFDNNTKLAAGLASGDLHIFDLIERKEIKHIQLHKKSIFSLAENKTHNQLYVADGNGFVSVWDTQTLDLLIQLPFSSDKIRSMQCSNDEKKMYLSCKDGDIRVLDCTYFNLIHQFFGHLEGVGVCIEVGNQLVSGGKDAFIKTRDLTSFELIKSIPAHNYMVYDLLLLNDEILVSASRDKTIKIWDLQEMKVLKRLDIKQGGHRHSVNKLLKINGNSFVSASDDARLIVWGV